MEPPVPQLPCALVIDDEPAVRGLVAEFLQALGFETQVCADGAVGLRAFDPESCTLVVTDLVMPGMTGWAVIDAIRQRAPRVAIILTSGSIGPAETQRAEQAGVVVLPKPFGFDALRAAVDTALRAPRPVDAPSHGDMAAAALASARPPEASPVATTPALRQALHWLDTLVGATRAVLVDRESWEARWRALEDEHQVLREIQAATRELLEQVWSELATTSHVLAEIHAVLDRASVAPRSAESPGPPPHWLIVVARQRPQVLDRLRQSLAHHPDVDVVLDRREGDRRRGLSVGDPERRHAERRQLRPAPEGASGTAGGGSLIVRR